MTIPTHTPTRQATIDSLRAQGIGFDPLADTRDLHLLLTKLGTCRYCEEETADAGPATVAHPADIAAGNARQDAYFRALTDRGIDPYEAATS